MPLQPAAQPRLARPQVYMGDMFGGFVPGKVLRHWYVEKGSPAGYCAAYQVTLTKHKTGSAQNAVMVPMDLLKYIRLPPGKPAREGVTVELHPLKERLLRMQHGRASAEDATELLYRALVCPHQVESLADGELMALMRRAGTMTVLENIVQSAIRAGADVASSWPLPHTRETRATSAYPLLAYTVAALNEAPPTA